LPSKNDLLAELRSRSVFPDWLMQDCNAFTGSEEQSLLRYFPDLSTEAERTPFGLLHFMQDIQTFEPGECTTAVVDYIAHSPSEQRWVLYKILRGEKKSLFEVLPIFCESMGIPIGRCAQLLLRRRGQDFFNEEIIHEVEQLCLHRQDIFPAAWKSATVFKTVMHPAEGQALPWPYERALLLATGENLWWQDRWGRVYHEESFVAFNTTSSVQLLLEVLLINEHQQVISLSEYRKLSIRAKRRLQMVCTDFFDVFPGAVSAFWQERMEAFKRQRAEGNIPAALLAWDEVPKPEERKGALWVKSLAALFQDSIFRAEEWQEAELHLMYVKLTTAGRREFVFGEEREGKWKGLITNPEGYETIEDDLLRYVAANILRKSGPVQIVRPGFSVRVVFSANTGKGRISQGNSKAASE
jgi:hypothetical protein